MHPPIVLAPLCALTLAACTAQTETSPESQPKSEAVDPPTPVAQPSLEGAPAVPGVKVLTPPSECPPLPTLPKDAPEAQLELARRIEVLRGIACQPELFGQSTPEIFAALGSPEGFSVYVGRRTASVPLGKPIRVADILAVVGISDAKWSFVRTEIGGWRFVDASGNPPTPWPRSELWIESGPKAEVYGTHGPRGIPAGTKMEFDPEFEIDSVEIVMPESALEFEHDAFASAALLEALTALALADDLHTVESGALPSLGERYTLSHFSWPTLGTAPVEPAEIHTSIYPNRTELLASDLAAAMGLPSPTAEVIESGDSKYDQLASAGNATIVWRGLSLEFALTKGADLHEGLAGWIVDYVTVLPAPSP